MSDEEYSDEVPAVRRVEEVTGPGGERLATVVRLGGPLEGIHFFSLPGDALQLGAMNRPRGHRVAPHAHAPLIRASEGTPEVLLVLEGMVRLDVFLPGDGDRPERVRRVRLGALDAAVIHPGTVHAVVWLTPARVVEVKGGCYYGPEVDKIHGREPDGPEAKTEGQGG